MRETDCQPLPGNSKLVNKVKWLAGASRDLLRTIILHQMIQHLMEVLFGCSQKGFFCNHIAVC